LQYGNRRFKDFPVVMVSWQSATAYCKWAGANLPSEAQWEKAARGTDGRLFPWGNNPNPDGLANYSSSSPEAVGSYIAGASPYGAYDMAGNVLEWVKDYFTPLYYEYSPLDNPLGPASGDRRGIRGGSFEQTEVNGLRTVARASLKPGTTKIVVGFRCAASEP
jgi:formylglycine-generating enzyme required for sulfatase activity